MTPPPKFVWVVAASIAILRALPFVATLLLAHPAGQAFLQVGYLPGDMHSYLSFIRQVPDGGHFFFENHYVTTDQSGRFILLFHWAVGVVSTLSGLAPLWVLELSRIPLIFVFFWAVWWFLEPIFENSSDPRQRVWATIFIGFSGGIEGFLRPLASRLPDEIGIAYSADTWHLFGWSTFASLNNPLWVGAFILYLVVLKQFIRPVDRARINGRRRLWSSDIPLALGLVLLFFVHPYSAIPVIAVALSRPVVQFLVERTLEPRRLVRESLILAAAIFLIALVSRWQLADPVFKASAGGFYGTRFLSPFWYPLTFGLVLALALRSGAKWMESLHPYRSSFIAWIGVIVILHSSTVINGFHFIPYLHMPLAILAASAMPGIWDRLSQGSRAHRTVLSAILLALFATPVLVTIESMGEVRQRNLVPQTVVEAITSLGSLPPGRVLAPPQLGLLLPAYTAHRVWVGHWFMTPDYRRKVKLYGHLITDPEYEAELLRILDDERIDYFVVPDAATARLLGALGSRVAGTQSTGGLDILHLSRAESILQDSR